MSCKAWSTSASAAWICMPICTRASYAPVRLDLDLFEEQRRVRGEDRHERARDPGSHTAAAQIDDERTADVTVRVAHGFHAMALRRARLPPVPRRTSPRRARALARR